MSNNDTFHFDSFSAHGMSTVPPPAQFLPSDFKSKLENRIDQKTVFAISYALVVDPSARETHVTAASEKCKLNVFRIYFNAKYAVLLNYAL